MSLLYPDIQPDFDAKELIAALQGVDSIAMESRHFCRIILVEHGSSTLDEMKIRKGGTTLLQKAGHDSAIAKGRSQDSILQELQESPDSNHLLTVDPSLSPKGKEQAKRAGIIMEQLRQHELLVSPYSSYTSCQNRPMETAYEMGFQSCIDLPYFNERIMMPQAGQTKDGIAEKYPEIAEQMRKGLPLMHEGIEDMEFFLARIARGMEIIKQENSCTEDHPSFKKWQVIVTHQTVIKMLIASTLDTTKGVDPFAIDVPNCSLTPLFIGNRPFTSEEDAWHQEYRRKHRYAVPRSNVFNPKSLLHDDWNTLKSMPVTIPVLATVIHKDHCDLHH